MGHVARLLEEAGIATVIIAVAAFETRMRMMTLPRVLLTPHPLGRPVGPPGDRDTQLSVIQRALDLLETAPGPGTIALATGPYRRWPRT
jgi:hypothetical protein